MRQQAYMWLNLSYNMHNCWLFISKLGAEMQISHITCMCLHVCVGGHMETH